MPWRPSTSDQVRASAIWPTAAAAWLSSSLSGPAGSLSTARPSAMAPEETTSTSRLSRCNLAMSSASDESQASCNRPPSLSTRSEEPTFITIRRKSARERALRDMWKRLRLTGGAREPRGLSFQLLRRQRIGLVERDHLGLLAEPLAIRFELRAHGLVGRARMLGRAVDEMQEHAAALDVAEKTVAESRAFMRALDQARNISEYELAAVDLDHAELGMQCRERVVGDLRLGRAHRREEGRLARVGQPDNAGVRNQLEAQPDRELLARLAGIGMARRTVGRTLEMGVAEAALTAAREHRPLTYIGEVREQGLAILLVDLRAGRHLEHDIVAARAVAVLAHAAAAVLGFEMLLVAVVDEGVEPIDRLHDHVAALAAVAAVRPAELDEFLAPERHAAVPAVARANIYLGFIEEFHDARYAIAAAKYESARERSPRAALKKFGQKLNRKGSTRREGPGRAMPH